LLTKILNADLNVDINQLGPTQANDMNKQAHKFGLMGNDFYSMLTKDVEEQEALRAAREQEEEKALYSVRIIIVNYFCSHY
jgi:splicing factor, arginine/serine-rich 16